MGYELEDSLLAATKPKPKGPFGSGVVRGPGPGVVKGRVTKPPRTRAGRRAQGAMNGAETAVRRAGLRASMGDAAARRTYGDDYGA